MGLVTLGEDVCWIVANLETITAVLIVCFSQKYYNQVMILYVDETENNDFFIVTGLLLNSRDDAESIYKSFKKKARNMPIAKRDKQVVFTEFKSVILDKHYQKIKKEMLLSLSEVERHIIYSYYTKKSKAFPQNFKEDTYIALLSRIVLSIDEDISIIFDTFNKQEFENRIIDRMSAYGNVQAIMSRDSQIESGLQLVDNVCSVIRHNLSRTDKNGFYQLIESWVKKA